ncbi:MAG: hypothetical protein WBM00_12615 [Solirubrobacterales bacterium]
MPRQSPKPVVEAWFNRASAHVGAALFDDLHVTAADPTLRGPGDWYGAALRLLEDACAVRDAHQSQATVALAVSLRSGQKPLEGDLPRGESLSDVMDRTTPPSVYVFSRGAAELVDDPSAHALAACPILVPHIRTRCFLREWMDSADGEYRRVLWVTA